MSNKKLNRKIGSENASFTYGGKKYFYDADFVKREQEYMDKLKRKVDKDLFGETAANFLHAIEDGQTKF